MSIVEAMGPADCTPRAKMARALLYATGMANRAPSPLRRLRFPVLLLGSLLVMLWVLRSVGGETGERRVTYTELLADIDAGKVTEASVRADAIVATLRAEAGKAAEHVVAARIPSMDERGLLEALEKQHVAVTGDPERTSTWGPIAWTIVPPLVLLAVWWSMGAGIAGGAARGRPMTFGRSKARLYDRSAEQAVTFEDVAGADEAKAELREIVSFLREPAKYTAIGAHVPKGVLLVGAPGTGKTLLARAVAGESGVPFFSMSGSEFVEMFVGVGASRVRDLFEQAKERAPCIIFIDELDAVGKTRAGAAGFAANEEREQTLNQLLVEMDGFAPGSGLVIMAATNRPEILDRALLRAGRFDRQVTVDRPDVRGREAILKVHARKVELAPDVDLGVVGRRTPGMVGADLANVVNEAALAAVRRAARVVTMADFEEAIDRLQLGLRKEGRVMSDDEKRRVAFHEAGHALVALSVQHADPVHRVTIIPRTVGALGATLQLPTEDRYLLTRDELYDRLCVLLGGRSAEEIACGVESTGAEDDLERATETARQMVCRFGMSDVMGPTTWGRPASLRFLSGPAQDGTSRDFSEETARRIDGEVRRIVEEAHGRATRVLRERREALAAIAAELLTRETLERSDLEAFVRKDSGATPVARSPAGVPAGIRAVAGAQEAAGTNDA
jgi:cell division protease FtsH